MSRLRPGRIAAIAALAGAPALLGALAGDVTVLWSALGAAGVLFGLGAIRLMRGRWLTAPHLMLLFCFGGMAVGLLIDRQSIMPSALASLCLGVDSLAATVVRHWAALPATNLLMLLGGLATIAVVEMRALRHPEMRCRKAICARTGFNLACSSAMLAGMILGAWLGPPLAARFGLPWGASAMMSVMAGGMVWGMAVTMALYRTAIAAGHGIGTHRLLPRINRAAWSHTARSSAS